VRDICTYNSCYGFGKVLSTKASREDFRKLVVLRNAKRSDMVNEPNLAVYLHGMMRGILNFRVDSRVCVLLLKHRIILASPAERR
jgi:hypothetical protein